MVGKPPALEKGYMVDFISCSLSEVGTLRRENGKGLRRFLPDWHNLKMMSYSHQANV